MNIASKASSLQPVIILLMMIFIIIGCSSNVFATDSLYVKQRIDSLRQDYQTRSMTEKIIALPGQIVYLPIHVVSLAIKEGIRWTDEENIIPRVQDVLTSDDGKRGLVPKYGSRIGGGLSFYLRSIIHPDSKLSVTLTGDFDDRQYYELLFNRIRFANDRLQTNFTAFYHYLPKEDIYGIGPFTQKSQESEYSIDKALVRSSLGLRISKHSTLEVIAGIEKNRVRQAKDLDEPEAIPLKQLIPDPIRAEDLTLSSLSLEWEYLGQNHPGHPVQGWDGFFRIGAFQQINGTDFGFFKLQADIKRYIHLFYGRALVVRTALEITDARQDKHIPFYYLSSIGRQETLRGFERGRYRDFDSFITSLEYRYPVSGNLDGLVFVDGGQVARDVLKDIDQRAFQVTFGLGLRLWNSDGEQASLQLGKSRDGYRLYFNLN